MVFLINVFLLTIGLLSCSQERTYEIKIVNETEYYLNKLSVGEDVNYKAVGPNQTSGSFDFAYKPKTGNLLTQPLLRVTVLTYSDSSGTFENSVGGVVDLTKFQEGRTNYIYIKLAPSQPNTPTLFTVAIN